MKNALDNVLTMQASVVARMKELDNLDSTGDDLDIQYQTTGGPAGPRHGQGHLPVLPAAADPAGGADVVHDDVGLSLFNYISRLGRLRRARAFGASARAGA
jgi:flagellar hook-associated protein 3 FlgL